MGEKENSSKEVKGKRIGFWQLAALFIYGFLIVLSIPLVENLPLLFSSSKRICNQVLSGEISQRQASGFLVSKENWRLGVQEDWVLYNCAALLKERDGVKGKQ